ncbi:unnamed protein product [marine sediment metagenome]|uniref:Uncharacterized protein n=1 Tax=marine sediment metagenome TaxID=412755 RepID=X1FW17_9ZZZZ
MKPEKKPCALCGKSIERTKGQPKKAVEYEIQSGAHIQCQRMHKAILEKHHISPNDYLNAVIGGMFLVFPELEETRSMKDYKSRMRKAEEEIEIAFPHLEKQKEEKKVEEKKQGEEKGEKINDKI